jgi:hypothetical protein
VGARHIDGTLSAARLALRAAFATFEKAANADPSAVSRESMKSMLETSRIPAPGDNNWGAELLAAGRQLHFILEPRVAKPEQPLPDVFAVNAAAPLDLVPAPQSVALAIREESPVYVEPEPESSWGVARDAILTVTGGAALIAGVLLFWPAAIPGGVAMGKGIRDWYRRGRRRMAAPTPAGYSREDMAEVEAIIDDPNFQDPRPIPSPEDLKKK